MSEKEIALHVLSQLPKDVTFKEIREEVDILQSIRKGIVAADQGKTMPHEEVRGLLLKWNSELSA